MPPTRLFNNANVRLISTTSSLSNEISPAAVVFFSWLLGVVGVDGVGVAVMDVSNLTLRGVRGDGERGNATIGTLGRDDDDDVDEVGAIDAIGAIGDSDGDDNCALLVCRLEDDRDARLVGIAKSDWWWISLVALVGVPIVSRRRNDDGGDGDGNDIGNADGDGGTMGNEWRGDANDARDRLLVEDDDDDVADVSDARGDGVGGIRWSSDRSLVAVGIGDACGDAGGNATTPGHLNISLYVSSHNLVIYRCSSLFAYWLQHNETYEMVMTYEMQWKDKIYLFR
jgi:hypothetical protein